MKKYIIQAAKNSIEELSLKWAINHNAADYQKQFDTPEARKQVAACELNMKSAEEQINWFKEYLKKVSK